MKIEPRPEAPQDPFLAEFGDGRLTVRKLFGTVDGGGEPWAPMPDRARLINSVGDLHRYLRGLKLPSSLAVTIDGLAEAPINTDRLPLEGVAQSIWDRLPIRGQRFQYAYPEPARIKESLEDFVSLTMAKEFPKELEAVHEARAEGKKRFDQADKLIARCRQRHAEREAKLQEAKELERFRREKAVLPTGMTTKAVLP